jgi:pimeloyl-ACP methyl ester carboxylesterase
MASWPYDIYSYVDVAPLPASAGYRVIVPYLRGYGTTRFLSSETFRNAQQSVVALDIIALMDALKIEKAIVAGFDWGARTANIIGALWPERCKAMVSVSGYLIGSPESNKLPLPPKAELAWWYQYYLATERDRAGYGEYRRDFAKLIWQIASPNGTPMMPRLIAPRRPSTIRISLMEVPFASESGSMARLPARTTGSTWTQKVGEA